MEVPLEEKRALVTGANSGIGASIAAGLAAAGARVCVNYVVSPEAADAVVAGIRQAGGEAMATQADVSQAGQVGAMFASIDQAWGGVDILVNNAGVDGPRALAWEADPEDWDADEDTGPGGRALRSDDRPMAARSDPAARLGCVDRDASPERQGPGLRRGGCFGLPSLDGHAL